MYEFLITNLRNCAETNSLSRYKRELMKQAADAIEELSNIARTTATIIENEKDMRVIAKAPRWIPVTERLPEDCTPVQVCYIGYYSKKIGSDMVACRYEGLWCYWDGEPCSYDQCHVEITHWMPLPEPPKEET